MTESKTTVDNLGEAISVLIQAVNIAQAKGGVYSFGDASKINAALEFIDATTKAQAGPKAQNEVVTNEVDATVEK